MESSDANAIYIIKFLTKGNDGIKKMSTTRHMSLKTLNAIPYLAKHLESGSHFKDSIRKAPVINTIDLTIHNIHLEDLIVYFNYKKKIMMGKPITQEIFRPLEIKPVRKPAASVVTDSATSATATQSRKEKERQTELLKQEEQEWQEELQRAKLNPRFNLHGFFKLCDVLLDHDVIKKTAKFASEYTDFGVLPDDDDLLSDIAIQYLDSVFKDGEYSNAFKAVRTNLDNLRTVYDDYLAYANKNRQDVSQQKYDQVLEQMGKINTVLLTAIDRLLRVVKHQAENHLKKFGQDANISDQDLYNTYIGMHRLDFTNVFDSFVGGVRFPLNLLPVIDPPIFHKYSRMDIKNNPMKTTYKVSYLVEQYISHLNTARRLIKNLMDQMPDKPLLPPRSYLIDGNINEDNDAKIIDIIGIVRSVEMSLQYVHHLLNNAKKVFEPSNVFDPTMHFTQRVSLFVLQSPAIAKAIWEAVELRKTLVLGYMNVSNTKSHRYINGAFEELIPLTEGRITSKDNDITKAIWTDPILARLYRKYNSWEYRFRMSDSDHGVDLVWHQIQMRTKYLIDKVQTEKQQNAPRGLLRPGWFL